jgi:uncharacterized membrane protein (DUF373 family)
MQISSSLAAASLNGNDRETLLVKAQNLVAFVLAVLLIVVVLLSTLDLGFLITQEIWKPPRFLIAVHALLEIFSFYWLVLLGVELLETLKTYVKKDVIHVRLVLAVALIVMAREVITLEPSSVPGLTLFGMAALILALGVAFHLERQAPRQQPPSA